METILLDGAAFRANSIATEHSALLVICAPHGMLGCGYLNVSTAERLGDALAIVTGVKNFDDMLAAEVKSVSPAAAARGVRAGMTGRDALLAMK